MLIDEYVFVPKVGTTNPYHNLPEAKFMYKAAMLHCESHIDHPAYYELTCYGPHGHEGFHEVSSAGGKALARWYSDVLH